MKLGDRLIYFSYLRERVTDAWSSQPARTALHEPRDPGAQALGIDDYDEWYYSRPVARAYLNHPRRAQNLVDLIEYFAPTRVFEFGSGLGHVLREARRRGIPIVGTETSDYAGSHSLCPDATVKIGEIPRSSLPFADGDFDLVFSSEVMEHVSEACTLPTLHELHRICSRYALFTINTSNREEPGHINVHPRQWWLTAFAAAGFAHNDRMWKEMERMKFLDWEIFVLEKSFSVAGSDRARSVF